DIVDQLDWTEAKTSQVVNDMKEQNEIEVFRIGRENILRLPEEETGEEDGS
ncbi:MAG: helix-turn-helix transcriptional regulator, partial [Halobacteriaceae archaeon]